MVCKILFSIIGPLTDVLLIRTTKTTWLWSVGFYKHPLDGIFSSCLMSFFQNLGGPTLSIGREEIGWRKNNFSVPSEADLEQSNVWPQRSKKLCLSQLSRRWWLHSPSPPGWQGRINTPFLSTLIMILRGWSNKGWFPWPVLRDKD